MSVLTGEKILKHLRRGEKARAEGRNARIWVEGWKEENVGPNSIDLHLGTKMLIYQRPERHEMVADLSNEAGGTNLWPVFDPEDPPKTIDYPLNSDGEWILEPGRLYLGETAEHTETRGFVSYLDGRSSWARCGVGVHVCAGRGDDWYIGKWTAEIWVVGPFAMVLRPGMRIFQLTYHKLKGKQRPYQGRYQNAQGVMGSLFHQPRKERQ